MADSIQIPTITGSTDHEALALWLEQVIRDNKLGALINALTAGAVLPQGYDAIEGAPLDPIEGSNAELEAIANNGIRGLGMERIKHLFRNPGELSDVMEALLVGGYWRNAAITDRISGTDMTKALNSGMTTRVEELVASRVAEAGAAVPAALNLDTKRLH